MTLAVVRVRGIINVKNDIRDTLTMLGLGRVNHCVLISENPQNMGMVRKVKDYVTWGPIDTETATLLVKERGQLKGRKALNEKDLKELGKYKSFEDLGKALADGDATWSKMDDTVRVFRLHPPRKGYEGIKRTFNMGGALGDRGQDINVLLQRMM
ncbi:MAG: 50S ribosomal protein L30 [Thermoplasmata archaeon]|nr:50S ribosomal protein L30 [Thermoplasmata archaeon]